MIPYFVDLFLLMFEFDGRMFKHTEAQVPPLHVLPTGTVTVQIHSNYRFSTASQQLYLQVGLSQTQIINTK